MRELKDNEISNVSGGSLTSLILDFFKNVNSSSQQEPTEWTRPEKVPPVNTISGEAFGMGVVSVVGAVAAFVVGLFSF